MFIIYGNGLTSNFNLTVDIYDDWNFMWDEDMYKLANAGHTDVKDVRQWTINLSKANELLIEEQLTLINKRGRELMGKSVF